MTSTKRGCCSKLRIAHFGMMLALSVLSVGKALGGPIHDAARKGDVAKVSALLKKNPDLVESRDKFGNTPLHLAALHDQPAVAALLLANGADVNAQNIAPVDIDGVVRSGETPLTLALLSYQHKEMMELLLTHGADVNIMLFGGVTPLRRAIARDLPNDVELLLANGADPNTTGPNLQTPLMQAVAQERTAILELLLRAGADPNAKDSAGRTPLSYAKARSNDKGEALLRAHGTHD